MSDLEALYTFLNSNITSEMVKYLVATTTSIISVQDQQPTDTHEIRTETSPTPSLYEFINGLIRHSHVQVTTLVSCLVYLNRLKQVIPPNSVGMATTHHRIFLGSMLIAAKYTNDSSPMNKHWTDYTDGLLTLREVNALEIEMIQYIGWGNLRFSNQDLIYSLSYFLDPIKRKLRAKQEKKYAQLYSGLSYQAQQFQEQEDQYASISNSSSLPSLISASSSTSTVSSYMSDIPRKDSIQSIESTLTSINTPAFQVLDEKEHNLPKIDTLPSPKIVYKESSCSKIPIADLSLSLRPLRLKPTTDGEKKMLSRRNSSINLLPLSVPPSNKLSFRVVNNDTPSTHAAITT